MTAESVKNATIKEKEQTKRKEDKSKEKKDKELPLTKVVIRRLPPSLTAETFIEQISPVPDHNYFYFVPAEGDLGAAGFSRAYINFESVDDVFIFTEKFDNYVFIDSKGNEYPAIVEYAPFQKVPKNKSKKPDSRKGTIENDSDYIKFLEQLQNPSTGDNAFTPETILEEIENKEKELKGGALKSTPLLDYIRKKKEEKKQANFKLREERKKREEERRRKRDEDRKKKRDRDRERQREKERLRQRDKDREREREQRQRDRQKTKEGDSSQPVKLLSKQEKEETYNKSSTKRSDGENSETADKKYEGARPKTTDRGKERGEGRDRDRRQREKEDEEERRWQERERDRRERREKERKDREKKERERRDKDKEKREKERREREKEKERDRKQEKKNKDENAAAGEPTNPVSVIEKSLVKDIMVESTSSIEEQPSSSNETSDKPRDKQRARYKDRPERQIYNPGQRAAERRKQMSVRTSGKEGTPDSVRDGSDKTDSNNSSRRNSVGSSHSPRDN